MQTISKDQIINLFFMMDEFCVQFHQVVKSHSISDRGRHRNKPNQMSDAEVMLILIIFHFGEYTPSEHTNRYPEGQPLWLLKMDSHPSSFSVSFMSSQAPNRLE